MNFSQIGNAIARHHFLNELRDVKHFLGVSASRLLYKDCVQHDQV